MILRSALRRAAKPLLASDAGWRAAAGLRRNPCVVLAYHRISDRPTHFSHVSLPVFRTQMEWIRRHCEVLALDDLSQSARARRDRPHVLITFDDGYRDYFELAYPVLKSLEIPAITFLSTRFIDDGSLFWWDLLTLAVHASRKSEVEIPWAPERRYPLDAAGRRTVRNLYSVKIAAAPHHTHDALLQEFAKAVDVDLGTLQTSRQVMTWDEVRRSMDLTVYGGHTHTHVRVSCVDEETLDREIATGRDRMHRETGRVPTCFAYPFGDGSGTARQLLARHGFDTAFNIIDGYVTADSDWLDIHRFPAPASLKELVWIVGGWARQRPAETAAAGRDSART